MSNEDTIVRAQLAATVSARDVHGPIPRRQAVATICHAIESAAKLPGALDGAEDEVCRRLTVIGECAFYELRAGHVPRDILIQRIKSLPHDQQIAYSLRLEHGMSDWQIAETLNITEDAVVALVLRALMALNGVSDDSPGP